MPDEKKFKTFKEFWPEYLRLHSQPITRAIHYAGTMTGIAMAAVGVATGGIGLIVAAPIVTYGLLFPSHFIFEKNNPATFKNPLMSIGGDFKLLFCFLTGRIKDEYKKAGLDITGKTGNNRNNPDAAPRPASRENSGPSLMSSLKTKLRVAFGHHKAASNDNGAKALGQQNKPAAPRP
jgi:hypothetical protein